MLKAHSSLEALRSAMEVYEISKKNQLKQTLSVFRYYNFTGQAGNCFNVGTFKRSLFGAKLNLVRCDCRFSLNGFFFVSRTPVLGMRGLIKHALKSINPFLSMPTAPCFWATNPTNSKFLLNANQSLAWFLDPIGKNVRVHVSVCLFERTQ